MRVKCVTVKLPHKKATRRLSIAMNSVTQDMKFRQSLLKYSQKYGAAKAAIKYKTNRQYIYRWLRRYDGTNESLRAKSRRPHHHPNQHAEQELKRIGDMRSRGPNTGLSMYYRFMLLILQHFLFQCPILSLACIRIFLRGRHTRCVV